MRSAYLKRGVDAGYLSRTAPRPGCGQMARYVCLAIGRGLWVLLGWNGIRVGETVESRGEQACVEDYAVLLRSEMRLSRRPSKLPKGAIFDDCIKN